MVATKGYKDFVFCQNADGSWKDSILGLMGETSFDDFKNRQTDADVKACEKAMMLTLAGIKVLTTKYPESKNEWKFVVRKGMTYLQTGLNKGAADVQSMVNNTVIL
jgi:hypothetical protein